MFCFFVSYFPVIKKLSALFLVCRIIKVSFRLSETCQLWEHNIRAIVKISVQWSAPRVQRPASRVQSPASRVQSLESSVQSSASRVQRPEFNVQSPASRVQRPESNVQSPASRVQRPASSVQSPASNSCDQSPGIPVCHKKVACLMS